MHDTCSDKATKKLRDDCSATQISELQKAANDTIDAVMNGIIAGLSFAVAFLIYTPIQESIAAWLIDLPLIVSTLVTIAILIGVIIVLSYIFIQIKQSGKKRTINRSNYK